MEVTKKRRAVFRGAFTRVAGQLNEMLSTKSSNVAEIEACWALLDEKERAIRAENEAVLNELLAQEVSDNILELEIKTCDEYIVTYNKLKVAYTNFCHPQYVVTSDNRSDAGLIKDSTKRKFKLPTIEFKKFGGDVRDWLPFWSQFKKINDDVEILPEDKFQYLLQATIPSSRARELVESYPPTAENYFKAIESLRSRFGRDDILVEVYVRELLKLVLTNAVSTEPRITLSTLYDKIETQLRSLETLGITTETCTAMLYPLVESCLPEDLLRVWQRSGSFSSQPDSTLKDRLSRLMAFLKMEVEGEQRIALAVEGFNLGSTENKIKKVKTKLQEARQPTALGLMNVQPSKCIFCDNVHNIENCFKAQKLNFEEKQNLLKSKRACFRCAKLGHVSRKCRQRLKCIICGRQHIALLCPELSSVKKSNVSVKPESTSSDEDKVEKTLANHTDIRVILQTLRVKIRSEHGSQIVRAVIDSGSQRSYVLKSTAKELRYVPKRSINVVHELFGGVNSAEQEHVCYDVRLLNLDGTYSCTFEALDQDTICHGITTIQPGIWISELEDMSIKLSDVQDDGPIKLLIGADVVGKLYTGRKRTLKSGLVAFETFLGWTLMGKIPHNNPGHSMTMTITSLLCNEIQLPKLWQLDVIGIEDPMVKVSKVEHERAVQEYFEQNISVDADGRYEVAMPWLEGHPPLPSNYNLSKKRLENTLKKLRNDGYFEAYDSVFSEWLDEKIIEEVPVSELKNSSHYLPHRAVIKENSTTKVRPVFDASAKDKDKPSLNQCLEKGLNLIETIPSILLKFRMEKLGVISDIRKAFLQVGLHKRDRDYLRFLWLRKDGSELIYRHRRVVFGVNCSPFLLGATITHHLNKCLSLQETTNSLYSKETVLKLLGSFYVDNCVLSLPNAESLSKFIREATQVMALAEFDLRGWEYTDNGCEESKTTSVLGMSWNQTKDTLSIHSECKINFNDEPITKRAILSMAQRIFDPIGFTCPATLIPKLLLQKLWESKLSWDVEVDSESKASFLKWHSEIPLLFKIEIPRWIMAGTVEAQHLSLHVFCDASKHAYAGVVFLRAEVQGTIHVHLIQAKARVAPLKRLSIPRLELLAATIGARLYHTIQENMNKNVDTYFWSDSSTVLSWIRRSDEWATFVWNRTQEIRSLTPVLAWRHVPGNMNPADLSSRGCSPKYLLESRWWEGPRWLYSPPDEWPKDVIRFDENTETEIQKERKKKLVTAMFNADINVWYANFFSKYLKIVRMISWMRRFIHNCKHTRQKIIGELTALELQHGEINLIIIIQTESFTNTDDKQILSLIPFKDEYGVIRVRSRVSDREDSDVFRFPYILPAKHPVVKRLIYDQHVSSCHVGVQGLMSILREKYWILGGRRSVRSIISKCVICKRYATRKFEVQPLPLPFDRVRDAATFQVTGIDLAGPLFLHNNKKAWICLFTCAVYRAVHLDLVTSLSTNNFMFALRRFIARRGRPSVIYTDNGTNFVGTKNCFSRLDWDTIKRYSSAQQISWKLNPPSAPWWGGWWERLIGLVKQLLRKVLGRACLNAEELYTVLCDTESVLNARPLTYVSNKENDLIPLTPAMFMRELSGTEVPDCDLVDSIALNKRLKYLQLLRDDLRRRFRVEYLGQLRQLYSHKKTRNINVGEIVLIGNDMTNRMSWPLGRVIELFPGKDGGVRLVRIDTANGQLLRPVQRIYPLECIENFPMGDSMEMGSDPQERPTVNSGVPDDGADDPVPVNNVNGPSEQVSRYGRLIRCPKRFTH